MRDFGIYPQWSFRQIDDDSGYLHCNHSKDVRTSVLVVWDLDSDYDEIAARILKMESLSLRAAAEMMEYMEANS